MIRFACPTCGKGLRVAADKAGRRVACPGCGSPLEVPTAPPAATNPWGDGRDSGPGPAYCTDWNQLDGVLAGLSGDPRSARLPRASEDRFREALTAHADAVPGHAVERLGEAATIESVEAVPVYRVRLDSLYECRRVEPRHRPHAGEHVPPATVASSGIEPWAFEAPSPDGFVQAADELAVEGSQRVEPCGRCGGSGGEGCGGCSATGQVPCGRCSGRGQATCGNCGGAGSVRHLVRYDQKQKNCTNCQGGYIGRGRDIFSGEYREGHVCTACNGRAAVFYEEPVYENRQCRCISGLVNCPGCNASRRVPCPTCTGTGRLLCDGCRGSGRVVTYLAVVRTFEPGSASHAAAAVKVPGRLVERLDAGGLDPVIDLMTTEAPNYLHLSAGLTDLRVAVEDAFAESVGGCPADHRIARQRLAVGVATVHRVEYRYGEKSYSAWWLDGSEPLMVPVTSPLADAVGDLVDDALRLWEEGDHRAAALVLQDVIEMAKADRRCREALDDRRADIPPELWGMAGRVFSLLRFFKKNPVLPVVLLVVGGAMLLGVGVLTVGMLAGPKGQSRQVREVRNAEPDPVRSPPFEERRPREEPRPVVPPAAPDSVLAAEYWPITPGTTREYDEVRYEEGRAPGRATRKRVSYLADGVVETTLVRDGVLESGTLLGGAKITWRTTTPQRLTTARIRRTAEFVEYGIVERDGVTWLPVIKPGARAGDSWTYPVTDDTRQRDRVARFDLHRGRPSAVIEGVIMPVGSDEVIGETVDVLVRGVGLVERQQFVVRDGKKVLLSERVRVEE